LERLSAFSTQPSVCSKDLDTVKSFRELQVWRKAHELVVDVCEATRSFPREELYGLTSQLRRSAVSIPSTIAEGCGRNTDADFARFLDIAMGSASELEYQPSYYSPRNSRCWAVPFTNVSTRPPRKSSACWRRCLRG